jgi:hypothetical protein
MKNSGINFLATVIAMIIIFITTAFISISVQATKRKIYQMPENIKGIVIEKYDLFKSLDIVTDQGVIESIYCYEILYRKYEVGDTIK